MIALASVVELLSLLQLSLNVGVKAGAIVQESLDIYNTAFVTQKRDLLDYEIKQIRVNNKRIRDEFLALGGDDG